MARARNIKPGFYKNEDLAECSIWARYIFPGLWMLADRDGRLEDRPKRIKGELLPFDSQEVEPLLRELTERGFIDRYEIDGIKVIQILKFTAHQSPHFSEKPSELPEKFPESQPIEETKFPESPPLKEVCKRKSSRNTPSLKGGSQPPDSLNPDSLNPESVVDPPVEGLDTDTWKRWIDYRKQIKKPIKPVSVLAAQRELAGYGDDQAAVVERSIANGWQGLFPLHKGQNPASSSPAESPLFVGMI